MLDADVLRAFARDRYGPSPSLAVEPLTGGLETEGIALVRVARGAAFVVKPMRGTAIREYRLLAVLEQHCPAVAPRILGTAYGRAGVLYVFLEWICSSNRWPWSRRESAALVLEQLARVHECDVRALSPYLGGWDYDADVAASAAETLQLYERLSRNGFRIGRRHMFRTLERVARDIVPMRRQAIRFTGPALLHGDVHPGNTLLRGDSAEAVLLDWGRARAGSPLEDVMSWLHSLGFWEPSARRVHDSLLAHYRRARGLAGPLTADFRSACWLAGASNAMAGALRYHLAVAADEAREPSARWTSSLAAADWFRILRRADAVWRN